MAGNSATTFAGVDYEGALVAGLGKGVGVTNDGEIRSAEQIVVNLATAVSQDKAASGELKANGAIDD